MFDRSLLIQRGAIAINKIATDQTHGAILDAFSDKMSFTAEMSPRGRARLKDICEKAENPENDAKFGIATEKSTHDAESVSNGVQLTTKDNRPAIKWSSYDMLGYKVTFWPSNLSENNQILLDRILECFHHKELTYCEITADTLYNLTDRAIITVPHNRSGARYWTDRDTESLYWNKDRSAPMQVTAYDKTKQDNGSGYIKNKYGLTGKDTHVERFEFRFHGKDGGRMLTDANFDPLAAGRVTIKLLPDKLRKYTRGAGSKTKALTQDETGDALLMVKDADSFNNHSAAKRKQVHTLVDHLVTEDVTEDFRNAWEQQKARWMGYLADGIK